MTLKMLNIKFCFTNPKNKTSNVQISITVHSVTALILSCSKNKLLRLFWNCYLCTFTWHLNNSAKFLLCNCHVQ